MSQINPGQQNWNVDESITENQNSHQKTINDLDYEQMQNLIECENMDLDHYRKLVKTYIKMHLYSAALFWADKVVSLSNNNIKDICYLAQCMYLMKQYHRAAHLLRSHGLEKKDLMCQYLTVRSLLEAKEYTDALQVINEFELCSNVSHSASYTDFSDVLDDTPKNVQSAILYVKGRVYEAMDNRAMATNCYKQALHYDVHCFQAFEALVQNQMLSAAEEKDLLESLPINEQCSDAEAELLHFLYESKLKKYQEPIDNKLFCVTVSDVVLDRLSTNLDIQVSEAERLYYNCDYQQCYALTEKILKKDQFHSGCLPVHIACLVELKKTNSLFFLAHKLVDLYPESAIAWFAVGCYYYIIGKSDPARRYLSKATSLDRLFGPAWLAYGHSFAVENEHDQAMAAYFKATQLMKGCHLPLLYIGLECGLTNNLKLADKFFQQAQSIAPNDPFVLHEMGVISFSNADYKTAEIQFKEAMKKIEGGLKEAIMPKKWEALLNNLGHTCRKMKKYGEALSYHQQALVLDPLNPSTYSAIGFVQALMGNAQEAVDFFHKALGLRRDDTFATTMLGYVIEEMIDDAPSFHDAPKDNSKFGKINKIIGGDNESSSIDETDSSLQNDNGMSKLKVKLFSGWRDDTNKTDDSVKLETSRDVVVNYSANDMASEIEMLDSSTAFIEDL